ncbi:unnamed protein product, partial [Staurois parvus]
MTLGKKGLTCGAIKGLTVCCALFYCVLSVCFTMEIPPPAPRNHRVKLKGERPVYKQQRSLSCQQ